jgi:hypothetical protein
MKCKGCHAEITGDCDYIYNGQPICRACYWLIRFGIWPD